MNNLDGSGLIRRIWAAALACGLTGAAMADSLPEPTGPVILTVRGAIALTNGNAEAALDHAMIKAMGVQIIRTGTIWTEGSSEFQGVELSRLLTSLGADGSTLRLIALNEYAVDIPFSEAITGGPLLAFQMDGMELSPRDKGPLWMIYPYDQKPEYKNEVSYSRSVWQLTEIEVLP